MDQNKENIMSNLSSKESVTCPLCGGSGLVLEKVDSSDIYGMNADGSPVMSEVAVKCRFCNGGHIQRVKTVMNGSGIPEAYKGKYLNNFNWSIYRDTAGKVIDISRQKEFIEKFTDHFQKWEEIGVGLYIWSHMKGSGKTYLASCICNELMKKLAIDTKFVSVSNILELSKSADKASTNKYEKDPILALCDCRLLVIDDLGQKQSGSDWITDVLFRILDNRLNNHKVTIITSNINQSELSLDDRVVDRINRATQPIPLPDYCVRAEETNKIKRQLFKELGLV